MNNAASQQVPQQSNKQAYRKLFQRVAALSEEQRDALAQKLKLSQAHAVPGLQRLVAYVVPEEAGAHASATLRFPYSGDQALETDVLGGGALDVASLKAALKERLPAYMVPTVVMPLVALPRTANGKIDVRALPQPQVVPSASQVSAAPRTPAEESLASIWQAVLGIGQVGIHDNFFELGGDSILSIQIVSRAREAGLRLSPNQLFEHPTIAELAAATREGVPDMVPQAAVTGPVPLTPIQHWFFEKNTAAPQHWHQSILLEIPQAIAYEQVSAAIAQLWAHHDALRLRFYQNDTGQWQQENAAPANSPQPMNISLAALDEVQQQAAIAQYGSQLHASLNLSCGPAFQAAYFTRTASQPNALLLSLHHLVVDAVSWQILQQDLRLLLLSPGAPHLPEKTTSFQTWSNTLRAQAPTYKPELSYWLAQLSLKSLSLPQPEEETTAPSTPSTEGCTRHHCVTLPSAETRALLQTVPAAYNTQINDVLLTALAHTLLAWTGQPAGNLRVALEAHGREPIVPNIDTSRTVGWFTTTYPVRLTLSSQMELGASIKTIKEQLRQVPNKGLGYGVLRYLGEADIRQQLASFPAAEVLFNYLGQRDAGQSQSGDIRLLEGADMGVTRHPQNPRGYRLEINAWVYDRQLHVNWSYDATRDRSSTMETLANTYLSSLTAIIAHCQSVEYTTFTPSDFPAVSFTQAELDGLVATVGGGCEGELTPRRAQGPTRSPLEALYPLAPLQQAFLWHSLQTNTQTGLLHMRGTLRGELNAERLRQAWQSIFIRHPALRSSIHWEGLAQPVQRVAKNPSVPWQQLDWREHPNPDTAIADFLQRDRQLGFNLTHAPISRLTLIRREDQTHEMIWSCHHLMLDGWSGTLVFNQVLATYDRLSQGQVLPAATAPSFQSYLRWLTQQDTSAAEQYWRQALAGFVEPTRLPVVTGSQNAKENPPANPPDHGLISLTLPASITVDVQDFLRSHRLTLNTLVQGLWALLLHFRSGQTDVLFGTTVSGRQADMAGVDAVVGLLINVLPVRVTLAKGTTLLQCLRSLQTQQTEASRYAYATPSQIQTWSDCSSRLFNSLLVVENYPVSRATSPAPTLTLENLQSGIISTYGLTLIVKPSAHALSFYVQSVNAPAVALQSLLKDLQTLLTHILAAPHHTLAHLATLVPDLKVTTPTAKAPVASASLQTQKSTEESASPAIPRSLGPVSVTPRSPTELQLINLWQTVLNTQPLGLDANFFSLGGDSLLAVQLFNAIQTQLNCTLPLATLFQAPTIRQLAAAIDHRQSMGRQSTDRQSTDLQSTDRQFTSPQATAHRATESPIAEHKLADAWSSLVPIQTQGSQRPFFFHGGSADALTWERFSRLLGSDQPFYALQRPDLDGREIEILTVEQLAADCIKDMRTVQPHGPYLIGGHCFGGAVAFEIARQLQAQGEAIASLIQIDAYCPNALPKTLMGSLTESLQLTLFRLRKSYYYHGGQNLKKIPQKLWNRLQTKLMPPARAAAPHQSSAGSLPMTPPPSSLLLPHASAASVSPPTSAASAATNPISFEARYARAHQANIVAADNYQPASYRGPIILFQAHVQILDWRYGAALGWQTVTPNHIEIVLIPGLFGNLFNRRSGPLLAAAVKAHLDSCPSFRAQ